MQKRTKYGSKKVQYEGIIFDSQAEMEFYLLLIRLKEAGKVMNFEMQPKYELQPVFERPDGSGKKVRAVTYSADYVVQFDDGRLEVIDIKGMLTDTSRIKQKWFEYKMGVPLILLRRIKGGVFVDWEEYEKQKRERSKAKKLGIEIPQYRHREWPY